MLIYNMILITGIPLYCNFVTRFTRHFGCFGHEVCDPPCSVPDKQCNFHCECAPGFLTTATVPILQCQNINDCIQHPCQHNGQCVDLIEDYRCICPIEWNRGTSCNWNEFVKQMYYNLSTILP